ncbi:MAG: hypothetical protein ABWY83_09995 [Actinomycetota bacterium]
MTIGQTIGDILPFAVGVARAGSGRFRSRSGASCGPSNLLVGANLSTTSRLHERQIRGIILLA